MSAASSGIALAAKNVTVRRADRPILEGISVSAAPGGLIGLIGPNGAGKTTLLHALAGLLAPAAGEILLDGTPRSPTRLRSSGRIAYLPQSHAAHWPISVEALVSLGRLRNGWRRGDAERSRHVERALNDLNLNDFRHRPVDTLSGGEKARAHLARAVAQDTPILLADEPSADLDPRHAGEVMAYLQRRARERTVIVVLHDLVLAQRYCDRVVVIANGRAVADGSTATALTANLIREVYRVDSVVADTPAGAAFVPWDTL